MDVEVRRTTIGDVDFQSLVAKLTALLAELNGEKDLFYAPHNTTESIFPVVAYLAGEPVGCGGFRTKSDDVVEIKRMLVMPSARGNGVGGAILQELETWARELGYAHAVLETSRRLANAVSLYQKSSYKIIANYEPYVGIEDSVCMRKSIGQIEARPT